MSTRPKRRGHFCWCCGRLRPNEHFSGRGRARHLCKDCSKLGQEKLAYRQAVRDIDRLLNWDGIVRRQHRRSFERFLSHPDERVRRYAAEVAAHDARMRQGYREERLACEAEEAEQGREEKLGFSRSSRRLSSGRCQAGTGRRGRAFAAPSPTVRRADTDLGAPGGDGVAGGEVSAEPGGVLELVLRAWRESNGVAGQATCGPTDHHEGYIAWEKFENSSSTVCRCP